MHRSTLYRSLSIILPISTILYALVGAPGFPEPRQQNFELLFKIEIGLVLFLFVLTEIWLKREKAFKKHFGFPAPRNNKEREKAIKCFGNSMVHDLDSKEAERLLHHFRCDPIIRLDPITRVVRH